MKKIFGVTILIFLVFTFIGLTQAQEPEAEYVDLEGQTEQVNDDSQHDDTGQVIAETEKKIFNAKVEKVESIVCPDSIDTSLDCLEVKLLVSSGARKGEEISTVLDLRSDVLAKEWDLKSGSKVIVNEFIFGDSSTFQITEIQRKNSILLFLFIYVILVLAVGRWQGFGSLVGLGLSAFVILKITIPMTLAGWDPILVSILGGFAVLVPSIYLSHGLSKKTTIALVGTSIGLIFTGFLAIIAISLTSLTGFGAEESLYLTSSGSDLNMSSVLLASMIIGGIGLIDDVTVGQVAVIREIFMENKSITMSRLYAKAMNVGKDHIASMVNTLFLAYAASALPLLMLLVDQNFGLGNIINIETFAEEIIRTLVASSGLVLTLPITTLFAAYIYTRR